MSHPGRVLACWGRADEFVVDQSSPGKRKRAADAAIAICNTCNELQRCRAWVLSHDDDPCPVMVVGGLSPIERNRGRTGGDRCGSVSGYDRHRKERTEVCPWCRVAWNAYYSEAQRERRRKQREQRLEGEVA